MSAKRTYYGFSTSQQRKLLFETWEATGSITQACQKARLSRRTFYYWKPRFDEYGYAGLEEFASRVAHKLNYKSAEIAQRVTDTGVVIGSVVAVVAQAVSKSAASINEHRRGRILQDYGGKVDSGRLGKRSKKCPKATHLIRRSFANRSWN